MIWLHSSLTTYSQFRSICLNIPFLRILILHRCGGGGGGSSSSNFKLYCYFCSR